MESASYLAAFRPDASSPTTLTETKSHAMSTESSSSPRPAADLQSIGWWIESADDEIYGPVSRATLVRFLSEGVISPNTLVRHSAEFTKCPAMDVPGVREALPAGTSFLPHGDRLEEAWPRRKREQLALAADSIPCVWKNQPAVLVCLRCGAPYCDKYRARPRKSSFTFAGVARDGCITVDRSPGCSTCFCFTWCFSSYRLPWLLGCTRPALSI